MSETDMRAICAKSAELDNSLQNVHLALKRVSNAKCRLNKSPMSSTYQDEMTRILQEEQLLKNVRSYLQERKPTVSELTEADIANMDYDTTCKAIRAIQSKKHNTKWSADCEKDESGLCIPGTSADYKHACEIESALMEHRNNIKPVDHGLIRKVDLQTLIETLRLCSDLSATQCLNRIEKFMKEGV